VRSGYFQYSFSNASGEALRSAVHDGDLFEAVVKAFLQPKKYGLSGFARFTPMKIKPKDLLPCNESLVC
jgi:hypothetical protein